MRTNLFIIIACLTFHAACGQVKVSTMQSVIICSVLKYMEWPTDNSTEFIISVIGNDEVYDELAKLVSSRKAGIRSIVVKQVSVDKIGKSHIVFLGSLNQSQLDKAISEIGESSTLIITDKSGYLEKGSDFNFVLHGDKIAFQLNEKNILKKGIKVSAAVVTMAEKRI